MAQKVFGILPVEEAKGDKSFTVYADGSYKAEMPINYKIALAKRPVLLLEKDVQVRANHYLDALKDIKDKSVIKNLGGISLLPDGVVIDRIEKAFPEDSKGEGWYWTVACVLKLRPSSEEDAIAVQGAGVQIDIASTGNIMRLHSTVLPIMQPKKAKRFNLLDALKIRTHLDLPPITTNDNTLQSRSVTLATETTTTNLSEFYTSPDFYGYNPDKACYAAYKQTTDGKVAAGEDGVMADINQNGLDIELQIASFRSLFSPENSEIAYQFVYPEKESVDSLSGLDIPKICQYAEHIYSNDTDSPNGKNPDLRGNGIKWLKFIPCISEEDYKYQVSQLRPNGELATQDGYTVLKKQGGSAGLTTSFIASTVVCLKNGGGSYTNERIGYFTAHEVLHQYILRLGYILYGNPQYLYPDDNNHHYNKTINLSMSGDELKGGIQDFDPDKSDNRTIIPTYRALLNRYIAIIQLRDEGVKQKLAEKKTIDEYKLMKYPNYLYYMNSSNLPVWEIYYKYYYQVQFLEFTRRVAIVANGIDIGLDFPKDNKKYWDGKERFTGPPANENKFSLAPEFDFSPTFSVI